MEENLNLAPPYVITYNELVAYFEGDPTIEVGDLDDETRSCIITVSDFVKYDLLGNYLKLSYPEHGKVGLNISLNYNGSTKMTPKELALIMADNPRFSHLFSSEGEMFGFTSVVFKNGVVQYGNDNIYDPYKHKTDLMENLSKTLFVDHVLCSTEP